MTGLIVNRYALPDWHLTKAVVLVYPHKIVGREHLVSFYNKFLAYIPPEIKIILLVRDISSEKQIRNWCDGAGLKNEIEVKLFLNLFDIWIKDYAPLTSQEGGINIPVKFLYRPSYVEKKYIDYIKDEDKIGEVLGKELINGGLRSVEFIWDMGNLTHNGAGIAIISNKFIADNLDNNVEHELKRILHVFCGFLKIVFIPTEPGDKTGHVDGMVRFIDEKVLVVGEYPPGSTNHIFMNILAKNLSQDLGDDYNIIRLMNVECEDAETEGIASAYGNHMNFLRLGKKILVPYYDQEISKKPLHMFKSDLAFHKLDIEVVPVEISELKDLARLGGVLNCITWQVFGSK